jgi:MFS transporter, ACS family, tartrate transporter
MTQGTSQLELLASGCKKNARRLLGVLAIAYVINFIDRNSVAYAALTMNVAFGLTASQFGWATGLTMLSYSLLEVPSNLIMQRVGARLWLSRIMISWGLVASAGAFVVGAYSLYVARLLLGAAEAGFFPGVIMYLSTWFPAIYRTRVLAWFLLAIPASSLIGGPLAAFLLGMDGHLNLAGWQWIFLAEGIPAALTGFVTYFLLVDDPRNASWLSTGERDALLSALANEKRDRARHSFADGLRDVRVLVMTVIQFGFTLGTYGIGIWLPLILKEHNLNDTQIGLLSMLPYLAACIGMLLWARFVDRNGRQIVNLMLSCLFAMFGLIGSVLFSELVPSVIALSIALIGVSSARAIFWTIPQRFLVGTAAAGGIAFINSVGLLGGFVGPFTMGWLRELTGSFSSGLLMMAVILMVAAGFAAVLQVLAREPKAS